MYITISGRAAIDIFGGKVSVFMGYHELLKPMSTDDMIKVYGMTLTEIDRRKNHGLTPRKDALRTELRRRGVAVNAIPRIRLNVLEKMSLHNSIINSYNTAAKDFSYEELDDGYIKFVLLKLDDISDVFGTELIRRIDIVDEMLDDDSEGYEILDDGSDADAV